MMIGYWVVMAMVVCALVVIVVACANEVDPGDRHHAPRPAESRRPVWVALGASDLAGQGTPVPQRDNWAAQLVAALPIEVTLRNLGVSGSTLARARREQLPAALAAQPDVVTCWLAVNDLASGVPLPAYERDLSALLAALRGAGRPVIVGNMPDLARVPALVAGPMPAAALRLAAEQWNAAIARIAAEHDVQVVDLFADPASVEDFGPDGFHPSPAGHRRLAARFQPAVERALAGVSTTTEKAKD